MELKSNFESPERLIGYCEVHCETERALFNKNQVNDMLKLAGYPPSMDIDWVSMHEGMKELCKLARERLS